MRIMRLTVFVSVMLVTFGWWEHSYSQPNNNGNADAASEHSADPSNEVSLPVRIITTPSDQEKYDAEAKDREDSRNRDESNLAAQRSIAKSSEQVAHYTSLQVWIAGASIIFGILTLGTAVTAVIFARHSAAAAQDSVKITRQFGEAQTRAYVYAEAAVMNWFQDGAEAIITITNCGSTPAKSFSVSGVIDYQPLKSRPTIPVPEKFITWSAIGANKSTTAPLREEGILFQDLDRDQENYLSVRGTIMYTTIFDEIAFSEFSFMLKYRKEQRQKMQNTADKIQVFEIKKP